MRISSVLTPAALTLAICAGVSAQTFEVASIRPSAPFEPGAMRRVVRFGSSGGAESKDPTRWTCDGCPLSLLITQAYDVRPFQVVGLPPMPAQDRFDIRATLAPGTTKAQQRIMLQNLLAERFSLKLHHESKEMAMYDLVVGKGGPKLKESVPEPEASKDDVPPPPPVLGPRDLKMDADGFPMLPPGANGMLILNGKAALTAYRQTMADLCATLSGRLDKIVKDATGLTGKYDFRLTFALEMQAGSGMAMGPGGGPGGGPPPPPPPPGAGGGAEISAAGAPGEGGPTIFAAVQQQLGLKLEAKKGPVDTLVVDHYDKAPTEN